MIYIIVLNWNGWQDTIECLDSLLRLEFSQYRIIVCDNHSQDQSMEHIGQWIDQLPTSQVSLPGHESELALSAQRYQWIDHTQSGVHQPDLMHRFILIQTGENRGYGPGNNVGIKLALQDEQMQAVWILNNDVVVESSSLTHLYQFQLNHPQCGLIGSKLMFYAVPTKIQAIGGKCNPVFATTVHLGEWEIDQGQYDDEALSAQMDYPVGAALFVTRAYLESVGLLPEEYFLYFEEMDWATRGARAGWQLGYCWQSRVFHKEGGSTGSDANPKLKSYLSDHYSLINRVRFTRKFYPQHLWSVKLGLLIAGANRLRRFQFDRLKIILRALAR